MSDKRLSETTDHELLLELLDQYKNQITGLEKELKDKHKPIFHFDGSGLRRVFDSWIFGAIIIAFIVGGLIFGLWYIWPSTYETGRFYVDHNIHNYGKAPPCECPPQPKELDDCYKVIKEVENGSDETMSSCMRNKDEAYRAANEFADEWNKLKSKAKGSRDD